MQLNSESAVYMKRHASSMYNQESLRQGVSIHREKGNAFEGSGINQQDRNQTVSSMYNVMKSYYGSQTGIGDLKKDLQQLAEKAISLKVDKQSKKFESNVHQLKMEISRESYKKYEHSLTKHQNQSASNVRANERAEAQNKSNKGSFDENSNTNARANEKAVGRGNEHPSNTNTRKKSSTSAEETNHTPERSSSSTTTNKTSGGTTVKHTEQPAQSSSSLNSTTTSQDSNQSNTTNNSEPISNELKYLGLDLVI